MVTEKKVEMVGELRDRIERCEIAIAADYRGLTVTEMVQLRRAIRQEGVELRVVKNRLFRRAAEEAGQPEMAELLDGPTAIIFGYGDITIPTRAASEYMRQAKNAFSMRSGILDGQLLSAAELQELGSLPPRNVLIGQIAGAFLAPAARLAGLFNSILAIPPGRLLNDSVHTFAGLVEARAKQLEGA